jgi:hypothetical protein
MVKFWWIFIALAVGAIAGVSLVLVATNGSGAKLNTDLAGLRTSLEDAVTINHGLADQLSKLQGQLDKSNRLLAIDDAVIAKQQLTIAAGQRIIAGIASSIANSGGDIAKTIDAIADGFKRLYAAYHPSASSGKSP